MTDIVDMLIAYAGSRSDGFAKLALDAADEIERLRRVVAFKERVERVRNDAQIVPEALKHAFTAGYWLWFGPANKRELDDGLAEIEKGWLEYEAALSLPSADRQEAKP